MNTQYIHANYSLNTKRIKVYLVTFEDIKYYNTTMNKKNEKQSLTIKELAKRLNISEQTYHNWKKDKPELIKLIHMGLDLENVIKRYK